MTKRERALKRERDSAMRALEQTAKDYTALRQATIKLTRACLFVNTEYDGLHRMLQASSEALSIIAHESGRPHEPKEPV